MEPVVEKVLEPANKGEGSQSDLIKAMSTHLSRPSWSDALNLILESPQLAHASQNRGQELLVLLHPLRRISGKAPVGLHLLMDDACLCKALDLELHPGLQRCISQQL